MMNLVRIFLLVLAMTIPTFANWEIGQANATNSVESIPNVPILAQNPELPTGCEATALTMLLQWNHVKVNKIDVARAFPVLPPPTYVNSKVVGGNPNAGYVGDPTTDTGYGVYHGPVVATLNKFLPNRALDLTGQSFSQLMSAIESGRPVMVWISDNLKEPAEKMVWYDDKGTTINWLVPEHTVVMTGFTPTTVTANDPETGKIMTYPRNLFEQRWQQMGSQAVTVTPEIIPTSQMSPSRTDQKTHENILVLKWKNWTSSIFAFLNHNKNSMWETYAKIFLVILVSYYASLTLTRFIRNRKNKRGQSVPPSNDRKKHITK